MRETTSSKPTQDQPHSGRSVSPSDEKREHDQTFTIPAARLSIILILTAHAYRPQHLSSALRTSRLSNSSPLFVERFACPITTVTASRPTPCPRDDELFITYGLPELHHDTDRHLSLSRGCSLLHGTTTQITIFISTSPTQQRDHYRRPCHAATDHVGKCLNLNPNPS